MELSPLFTNNMVLQAGKPIRFFGMGEGTATVRINGREVAATSENNKWLVELPPMEYGGPYTVEVVLNETTVTLENVMVGEVILCSGQSNIQFEVYQDSSNPSFWLENPMLRIFTMDRPEPEESVLKTQDGWCVCTKETIPHWSSVCYHLGQLAARNLKVAVGMVSCAQGASVIQSWIPEDLAGKPEFYLEKEKKHWDHFYPEFTLWNVDGYLYHYMTEKFFPMSVGNVVWYQGESNTTEFEGKIYLSLLKTMILQWRCIAMDETLPFTVVQISDFDQRPDEGWKSIQRAQMEAQEAILYVRTVVSRDVCESHDIHPGTKNILAYKLLLSMFGSVVK